MVERGLEPLETRLQRVEGRLKLAFAGWSLSVTLLLLLGALVPHVVSQPAVLRARAIEIVDQSGKVRINLGLLKDCRRPAPVCYETSEISMSAPIGKSGISLELIGGITPMLILHDSAGEPRAELHLDTNGSPLLWLFGTPRIVLYHSGESAQRGLVAAQLKLETDGSPSE